MKTRQPRRDADSDPRRPIRVSRARLTECAACGRHTRLPEDLVSARGVACAHCASALRAPAGREALQSLRSAVGRTGAAVAASLLGLGLSTACVDDDLRGLDSQPVDASSTRESADAAFVEPDATLVDSGHIDAGAMDATAPDAAPMDADTSPPPTPLYGQVPADGSIVPIDGGIEDAEDPPVSPEYGLPPVLDGGRLDVG